MNKQRWAWIGLGILVLCSVGGLVWWLRSQAAPILIQDGQKAVETTVSILDVNQESLKMAQEGAIERAKDSDGDGLPDAEEQKVKTSLSNPDSDGDGFSDGEEVSFLRTDPLKAQSAKEVRDLVDKMPASPMKENWIGRQDSSVVRSTSTQTILPFEPSGSNDSDQDDLTDNQELQLGTDTKKTDTDGDGLKDGEEVDVYRTSPLKTDTDGDTYLDGDEVKNGFNPLGPGKCANVGCRP